MAALEALTAALDACEAHESAEGSESSADDDELADELVLGRLLANSELLVKRLGGDNPVPPGMYEELERRVRRRFATPGMLRRMSMRGYGRSMSTVGATSRLGWPLPPRRPAPPHTLCLTLARAARTHRRARTPP